jgi:hypothetical protein
VRTMVRHSRQVRLAEVGQEGQTWVARATVELYLDGVAGEIAARYLAGAGVGKLRVREGRAAEAAVRVDPSVVVEVIPGLGAGEDRGEDFELREPAARELARAATASLALLREVLGIGLRPEP